VFFAADRPVIDPAMSIAVALAAIALLGFAAWRDFATRTIPDGVSIALAAIGIGTQALAGLWPLVTAIATAAALGGLLVFLHARDMLGGGDVKLATALALCLSPGDTLNMVFATALAGGVLGVFYLALQRLLPVPTSSRPETRPQGAPWRLLAVEAWRIRRRGPLPYGVAIAAGGTLVLLQTTAS
jgi:prepilin peptidase CpaA